MCGKWLKPQPHVGHFCQVSVHYLLFRKKDGWLRFPAGGIGTSGGKYYIQGCNVAQKFNNISVSQSMPQKIQIQIYFEIYFNLLLKDTQKNK
jgi:hypothetical protein